MNSETSHPLIFISHSSKDVDLAEQFVDSLISLGVSESNIFFSAKTHMGVGIGNRFTEVINQKLHESMVVFLLLTPNYYRSYNCQQEEGVAWYCMSEKTIYPIKIGISYDDMKGFIDKTVIAAYPEERLLRNVPYILKEKGFIDVVPDERDQFNDFIKKCDVMGLPNVVSDDIEMNENYPKHSFTDDDCLLLYYFYVNSLPTLYYKNRPGQKTKSISEYASEYDNLDYQARIDYFVDRGFIVENDDKKRLSNELFDELVSGGNLTKQCVECSSRHKKSLDTIEKSILSGKLLDYQQLILIYLWKTNIDDLGSRWLQDVTVDKIIAWENEHDLDHTLSDNYEIALGYLISNNYVFIKETTSYGNPRLYGVNDNTKEQLDKLSDSAQEYLSNTACKHIIQYTM